MLNLRLTQFLKENMELKTNEPSLFIHLNQVVKLFEKKNKQSNFVVEVNIVKQNNQATCEVKLNNELVHKTSFVLPTDELLANKKTKTVAKQALFFVLKKQFAVSVPWGSITGVRPTGIYYSLLSKHTPNEAEKELKQYGVIMSKRKLLKQIVQVQHRVVSSIAHNQIALYVHIPFCTTKCSYCTFITTPLSNSKCVSLVGEYVASLCKELKLAKAFIQKQNLTVSSVYVGGGTPTAITANQLKQVLSLLNYNATEFTVEAGRPDSITKEKLDVLKEFGVTRISINPQSFVPSTLKAIGRNHTVQEIFEAFELAKNYPFLVNMDLIAGLNGETMAQFKQTLKQTMKLNPHNITVHTLSLKRGSLLTNRGGEVSDETQVVKMVHFAQHKLQRNGYLPYYLYKQKYMLGNLENVGYCKPNTECAFNILSMEDFIPVLALGSGAISKNWLKGGKLEHFATTKDVSAYNQSVEAIWEKKKALFLSQQSE